MPAVDSIVIDEEFRKLIPPLTPEEREQLERNLVADGCRDPLVVWEGQGVLLDGHNRHEICERLGIEFRVVGRALDGRAAAMRWMILNQRGRRNLSVSQCSMLAAELANLKRGDNQHVEISTCSQSEAAELFGVSRESVLLAKKVRDSGTDELQQAVMSGAVAVSTAAEIAALDDDEQREVLKLDGDGIVKKAKAVKAVKKEKRRKKQVEAELAATRVAVVGESPFVLTAAQDVVQCDALISDPPYGILDESWEPKQLESFTREWATRWNECGAPFVALFWSQRYLWDGRKWFDESFSNYQFQQLLVWHYPNNKSPQSRLGFKQTWEPCYFYRLKGCDKQITLGGGDWGSDLNDFDCHVAAVPQSNFNDENMKQHPAQKAVSVMRWVVNALTSPGELVCDPFSGSGTTGIAALQLGRRYHGIEISDEYREMSAGRIARYGVKS